MIRWIHRDGSTRRRRPERMMGVVRNDVKGRVGRYREGPGVGGQVVTLVFPFARYNELPSLPSATAAGFLLDSGSGGASPVEMSTIIFASWLTSRGSFEFCHDGYCGKRATPKPTLIDQAWKSGQLKFSTARPSVIYLKKVWLRYSLVFLWSPACYALPTLGSHPLLPCCPAG